MGNRNLSITLLFLLIAFPIFLVWQFGTMDRVYFLSPINYAHNTIIRNDIKGNGEFGSFRDGRRRHAGVDLWAPMGTPVLAARKGRVISARFHKGMGNYIEIMHTNSLTTVYGHLAKIYVREGDFVLQGQVIGTVGKTGNARGSLIKPHLHFEVRINDKPVDPLDGYLE